MAFQYPTRPLSSKRPSPAHDPAIAYQMHQPINRLKNKYPVLASAAIGSALGSDVAEPHQRARLPYGP